MTLRRVPKIIEQGKSAPADPEQARPAIGLEDVLLVVGVLSLLAGIAMWSKPAALVVLGLLCLAGVGLIEAARRQR